MKKQKRAFKAFMESEERQLSPKELKEGAWFPISVFRTLTLTEKKLVEVAKINRKALKERGYTDEELETFADHFVKFAEAFRAE